MPKPLEEFWLKKLPLSEDGAVAAGAVCEFWAPPAGCDAELARDVTPVTCAAASAANMPSARSEPATSVAFSRESRSSVSERAIRPCACCAGDDTGGGEASAIAIVGMAEGG